MPTYISADEVEKGGDHDKINNTTPPNEAHHRFQRGTRTPGQLELGATDILEGRADTQRQVVASAGLANSHFRHNWEARFKSHYLSALVAEMFGVWFYVFAGQAATATYVLTTVAGSPQGDLTMIGFAYALGIMFAITVCAPTSGGHFHPAMTIAQVIFKGFPIRKAPFYILAQLLGAFLASMMVYAQWREEMLAYAAELTASGQHAVIFTANGPAGILAIFPQPGRSLGQIFANEFFGDLLIAMVIWSQLDAQNVFTSPSIAPYTIGLAFGVIVWGWSSGTIVTNTARDLGARFACGAIFGSECFPVKYSALAALTNIPASILGVSIYTFFLSDSRRPPAQTALAGHLDEEQARHELSAKRHNQILEKQITRTISRGGDPSALMAKRSRFSNSQTKSDQSDD